MGCFVRSQYFLWVRIKRDYDRRAICRPSVFRRSRNDCLMTEMHTVEHPDGEKKRALQVSQFGDVV
jgi:hypothetical protein